MGKALNITCEFIPQILFLSCMFGYMALLMFHKWTAYAAGGFDGDKTTTERCAPSILITFINMILFKSETMWSLCHRSAGIPTCSLVRHFSRDSLSSSQCSACRGCYLPSLS